MSPSMQALLMLMGSRLVSSAVAAREAWAPLDSGCVAGAPDGGAAVSCPARAPAASAAPPRGRDHSLLQLNRGWVPAAAPQQLSASTNASAAPGAVAEAAEAATQPCQPWQVTRRRRAETMCSCRRRHGRAELPSGLRCDEVANAIVRDDPAGAPRAPGPALPPGAVIGWHPRAQIKSAGLWCQVGLPPAGWNLKACPASGSSTTLKVLTYNLYWWNLFGRRHGAGQSAGRKIAQTSGPEQYDLMGFQECDHMGRILGDAKDQGLSGDYGLANGGRALAIAWRRSRFTWLAEGKADVGEDDRSQYYGKRSAQWVRLHHRNGQVIFFLNHHGPLPVSWGGGCTGSTTSYNILRVIAENAHVGDVIIVVGDFNAEAHSSRIRALDGYLNRVFSGSALGGVDHILSNCAASSTANLGKGGSDHDALSAVFRI
uniref:Endonuclease/exonuclease/phosphatase domain-containing protein n=1 Tax=Alexandrium monilatum TaxID=311494 RepID=A0A7S4RNR7_9DINO